MNCEKALPLVEKLADGEASPSERVRAEEHIERCRECRQHHRFVLALAKASGKTLPEPPEIYWERLVAKILARMGSDPRPAPREWFSTPGVLRFGAVAATIAVVIAGGLVVLRDGALPRNDSSRPVSAPADETLPEPPAEEKVETETSRPPIARDEGPPTGAGAIEKRPLEVGRRDNTPNASHASESSPALEVQPSAMSPEVSRARKAAEPPVRRQEGVAGELAKPNALETLRAADAEREYRELLRPLRDGVTGRSSFSLEAESCQNWRAYIGRHGDGPRGTDARYELARCSIRRYREHPGSQTRDAALRDAEAFLGMESEGPRAEAIGDAVSELRQ